VPRLEGNRVRDEDINFLDALELFLSLFIPMRGIMPGSMITEVNYCFLDLWLIEAKFELN
jgi:hypothetical protein